MVKKFMEQAILLAKKGIGFTSPNPCVGAVIVKGEKVIASGWHSVAGSAHAEINAINEVMSKSGIVTRDFEPTLFHNADLYVTLEPCCHTGLTPPCVTKVSDANFRKIFIGMKDPSKKVNGKSIALLKKSGTNVSLLKPSSSLYSEIHNINQPFIKFSKTGLPYVILKSAISLDGKIATHDGNSKWITSEESRLNAKIQRSKCDAVLIGVGTVMADNPTLGTSSKYSDKKLLRIIIDPNLKSDLTFNVYRDENVFVATTNLASKTKKDRFKKAGISFKSFGSNRVSIIRLLKYLGEKNVQSVFVEGGSGINGSFLDSYMKEPLCIDKVLFYISPRLIGGTNSLAVMGGIGVKKVKDSLAFESTEISKVGKDYKFLGVINSY